MAAPRRKNEPRRRSSPIGWLVLGALAAAPAVFTRSTVESFEFPKATLWITVSLLLAAAAIATEGTRAGSEGPGRWPAAIPARLVRWARSDPTGACVVLFVMSAGASTVTSMNPIVGLHGAPDSFAGLPTAIATASVYFASRAFSSDPRWLPRIAGSAAIASAIAAGYALLQLSGLDPLGWHRTASFGGAVRIFGTLGHPNLLGAYLVAALPLVVWRGLRAGSWASKAGFLAVSAASLAAIVATLSRGAWIAAAASLAAWLLLRRRAAGADSRSARAAEPRRSGASRGAASRTWLAAAIGLLALGAALIPVARSLGPSLPQRLREIGSLASPTTRSRLLIWQAGGRMAKDHPLFGVGLDAFNSAFPRYRTREYWRVEWGGTPTKAHNELVQIAATQGGFGLLAALLVVGFVSRATWRATRARSPLDRDGAVFSGAALVGFATQDLASFTTVSTGTLAAALAGWVAARDGGRANDPAPPPRPIDPAPGAWVAGLLGAGLLFVPFVMSPWRAERAAHDALAAPLWSRERIEGLRTAEAITPWNAGYPARLGNSLLVLARRAEDPEERWGLLSQAYSAYERAIRLEPHRAFERSCIGRALAMQSELRPGLVTMDRAREAFEEARRLDPTNTLVLLQEEDTYLGMGRHEEARASALRIAALDPEYAKPFADLGLIASRAGRYEGAADTLELAVSKDFHGDSASAADAWSNLSGAYVNLGRYEDALHAAERALEVLPEHAAAVKNRETALRALGRPG
ncbi:MAG: O-antigen ligase family protein [Candidatus Latescibacteria bacterium]|nr:O-antigen ligase family protein [Candidatus Latescibacterota bacterium]